MKKAAAILLIAVLSTAATFISGMAPLVRVFGLKSLDKQFVLYADPSRADKRIIFIEVDQDSLDHFEKDNIKFPWPRDIYNTIIKYASAGGAKAIIIDILFNNPSSYGQNVDNRFAKAMRGAGSVYMASAFMNGDNATEAFAIDPKFGVDLEGSAPAAIEKDVSSLPLSSFLDVVQGIGSVTLTPDDDGVYRRIEPMILFGDYLVPAIFLAPLVNGASTARYANDILTVGEYAIPVNDNGRMWINYQGPRGSYKRYSAAAVISSAAMLKNGDTPLLPQGRFKNAYVIIGYTAPGLYDPKPTPLSAVSPGMEAHAAALDTVLNKNFLRTEPAWITYGLAFIGAAFVAGVMVLIASSIVATVAVLAVVAALFFISGEAFQNGIWINLVTLETSAAMALIGSAVYRFQFEGKKKRYIKRAMQYYISPHLVEQILADPKKLKLGGEKRMITVFFSDLVGFTTLSERMEPTALVSLMNKYTTLMANTITSKSGTVDKYIGDAVMAFWGAPLEVEHHAANACLTALESSEKLMFFNQGIKSLGLPRLDMRIGLNTGEAVVGNMGSDERFDYTAVGDTVNLASRLEGLNSYYGTRILVSEATWLEAKSHVFGRKIDFLTVRGKNIPINVYEIMAAKGDETFFQRKLGRRYEMSLEAYMARKWDDAIEELEKILVKTKDVPSRVLLQRVRLYKENPPPDDWNGSFRHKSK